VALQAVDPACGVVRDQPAFTCGSVIGVKNGVGVAETGLGVA
jgi:hypothetical protein